MSSSITLYFTTRIGFDKKSVPFPSSPGLLFLDVVNEVCKKLGLQQQSVSISTPGGVVLIATDMNKTVNKILDEFGTNFEVIDNGVVGLF
jgi:hypothetical protein